MTDDLAQHYRQIISALGENPDREGLRDTPKRAAKAMQFLNAGYHQSLEEIVNGAVFESQTEEMAQGPTVIQGSANKDANELRLESI